ncbi:MAG: FAD-dependent oxidoreductase [Candidatus Omnitrophica bacterium]|nr:FAD-dependent oxidoreductase [Candidatus Omnitrophota bacterium]
MNNDVYDVIIIGGAAAGLTGAIYTSREKLKTLVLEKAQCGGMTATSDLIENYPGFPEGINGMELIDKFKQQAAKFGANIIEFQQVRKITPEGETIKVEIDKQLYSGKALIVATGSKPVKLNVPGETEFSGRGVSYCATCDGPLFKGKDLALVGCGNSGLQEGDHLLKFAKHITFIEFLPEMTAAKILQERLKGNQQATFLLNHALTAINGQQVVESVTVKERASGKEKVIKVGGVFIYAGFSPNSELLKGLIDLDDTGYIKTGEDMQTSRAGIYAVGDVRSKQIRQIDVACGEATIAAIAVRDYIKKTNN